MDMKMLETMGRRPRGSGDAETMEWLVLTKEEGRMLLLSKECLAEQPFHSNAAAVTWADCDLREWLRDQEEEWFTPEERARILTTPVETSEACCYDDEDIPEDRGTVTEDRLFLLSAREALRYFDRDEDRKRGTGWWLRSRGYSPGYAADVLPDGQVCAPGEEVYEPGGVRPAMWVRFCE